MNKQQLQNKYTHYIYLQGVEEKYGQIFKTYFLFDFWKNVINLNFHD